MGKPGIVQIAGTGSITYGVDQHHRHVRAGGWGYLFGDEGSGYDIGKRAIIAMTQAADRVIKPTRLTEALLDRFQVTHARALVEQIYIADSPKHDIAELSKLVFEYYKKNDPLAEKIISEAAQAMAKQIQTVKQNLFPNQKHIPLVLAGGIFSDEFVMPVILKQLLSTEDYQLIIPQIPPAGGSLVGALATKKALTALQINHIQSTLKQHI